MRAFGTGFNAAWNRIPIPVVVNPPAERRRLWPDPIGSRLADPIQKQLGLRVAGEAYAVLFLDW